MRAKLAALSALVACIAASSAAPASASSPTAAGAASPATVARGASTLLTVAVVPGTAPGSTGILVSCNLSALGDPFNELLADDGSGGDAQAGDLVFSYRATVAPTTPLGDYTLPCVVADDQGRIVLVSITLAVDAVPNQAPTVNAGGPYSLDEGSVVTLAATGSDPEAGPLTFAWDLNGDGTFETAGQTADFSAGDGPAVHSVSVRATDAGLLTALGTATVTVANVAPTAGFAAPVRAQVGGSFQLSLSSPFDPSPADTGAGFSYSFDCGSGYGDYRALPSTTCRPDRSGTVQVGGRIRDKDDGVTAYRAGVGVGVSSNGLCALTRSLSRRPKVADKLCAQLAKASRARTRAGRNAHLRAYRMQVGNNSGPGPRKAFSPADGALLRQLARALERP